MYKINTVKNYKAFAALLEKETGCTVKIKLMDNKADHVHYQLNDKYDMTLGVLCVDNGDVSFAPFETHESVSNNQYINVQHMVQFDDFAKLIGVFAKLFVSTEETDGV